MQSNSGNIHAQFVAFFSRAQQVPPTLRGSASMRTAASSLPHAPLQKGKPEECVEACVAMSDAPWASQRVQDTAGSCGCALLAGPGLPLQVWIQPSSQPEPAEASASQCNCECVHPWGPLQLTDKPFGKMEETCTRICSELMSFGRASLRRSSWP